MKIAIIGCDGQLGTDLTKIIPQEEQIALTIKDIDITDPAQTEAVIAKVSPDVVINTAAYHNVDLCEDKPEPAFAVNTFGVKYLAAACKKNNAALVQISTDYVFDGEKGRPYTEKDTPNPQSIYAISKLAGEQCVRYLLEKHYIVRTTGLYGQAGCLGKGGGNFVQNMIKRAEKQPELKVVTDEILSPTYTLHLAEKIYQLVKIKQYGLYHIVNSGHCSWYDFTVEIFKLLNKDVEINKTKAAEFKSKAKRPSFSALNCQKLESIGLTPMPTWQEGLKNYLNEIGYCS